MDAGFKKNGKDESGEMKIFFSKMADKRKRTFCGIFFFCSAYFQCYLWPICFLLRTKSGLEFTRDFQKSDIILKYKVLATLFINNIPM